MRILFISGYPAWDKVSKKLMPSQHLFGINELIKNYRNYEDGKLYGVLDETLCGGGTVDFYMWESEKNKILSQIVKLVKMSKEYDLYYDSLNRCSIYLGFLKKMKVFKSKLLTVLHHPPYNMQLKISNSNKYVFFSKEYMELSIKYCPKKKKQFVVNEWLPDMDWYEKTNNEPKGTEGFFIDNGKSRRDKTIIINAAEKVKVPVVYASNEVEANFTGYAKPYKIDLKDDFAIARKLRHYEVILVPILDNKKENIPIGSLGVTSFLDAMALEKPILASDNVFFSDDIKQNKLGMVYKTGSEDSLCAAMKAMYENRETMGEYRSNMRKYRDGRTIKQYSNNLRSIIEEIMENK